MPGLTVNVLLQDIKKLETDAVIVGFFEDVRPLPSCRRTRLAALRGPFQPHHQSKLRGPPGRSALIDLTGKSARPEDIPGRPRSLAATLTSAITARRRKERCFLSAYMPASTTWRCECFSAPELSTGSLLNGHDAGCCRGTAEEHRPRSTCSLPMRRIMNRSQSA